MTEYDRRKRIDVLLITTSDCLLYKNINENNTNHWLKNVHTGIQGKGE